MRLFIRTCLILALLPLLVWAFVAELLRGIRNAFQYAYLEVRVELDSFVAQWRKAGDL